MASLAVMTKNTTLLLRAALLVDRSIHVDTAAAAATAAATTTAIIAAIAGALRRSAGGEQDRDQR